MSASLNKVMLIGRLGGDVQVHKFDDGNMLANFTLATSEFYTDKNSGEKTEKTEWHRLVAKNYLAEISQKYLKKGDMIYCEGKLSTRSWNDNGVVKYTTEVVLSKIEFLTKKREDSVSD